MSNSKTAPASPPSAASPPPAKTSPVRLIVLLLILVVAVGVLAYDYKVAGPACAAGEAKIEKFVDERNKLGVKEGALVTAEDVRKELGMQPSKVEKNDEYGYTVEYYSWWGNVPVLNRRRHYISVVYIGQEPRHFSSYHRNSPPPPEALPIPEKTPPSDGQPLPEPDSSSGPKAEPAATDPGAAEEKKESEKKEPDTAAKSEPAPQ